MVTVAFAPGASWTMSAAIGFPTIVLRPTITHSAPRVTTPDRLEQLLYPGRRAGREAIGLTDQQLAHVDRMEAVDVLVRTDPTNHRIGRDVLRKRHLHQNAMHRGVGVEAVHLGQQVCLRSLGRHTQRLPPHAGLLRRRPLGPDIYGARRIVTNQYHSQRRSDATGDQTARHRARRRPLRHSLLPSR